MSAIGLMPTADGVSILAVIGEAATGTLHASSFGSYVAVHFPQMH